MTVTRLLVVIVIAALLAFQVIRSAVMGLPFAERLAIADRIWPGHPRAVLDQAMAEIGVAAAQGRGVAPATLARVHSAAAKSPLSVEPFLIQGAIAQMDGRQELAERSFLAARALDPRSLAARYFLADRYFRTGRVPEGLVEMAALARIRPGAAAPFLPSLAAYARTPGAVPQLKRFFQRRPDVEPEVLSVLSRDAGNADLVLALATRDGSRPRPEWHARLVQSLVDTRQYARAHEIWGRLSGVPTTAGLFNPRFEEASAPPPFNWVYSESRDGLAEPGENGGLEVLYYGRKPALLASQLLSLRPGVYRLEMQASGDRVEAGLEWSMRCANRDQRMLRLPLREGAPNGAFTVPSDCPAQWLELRGIPGDPARTVEVVIGALRLSQSRPQ